MNHLLFMTFLNSKSSNFKPSWWSHASTTWVEDSCQVSTSTNLWWGQVWVCSAFTEEELEDLLTKRIIETHHQGCLHTLIDSTLEIDVTRWVKKLFSDQIGSLWSNKVVQGLAKGFTRHLCLYLSLRHLHRWKLNGRRSEALCCVLLYACAVLIGMAWCSCHVRLGRDELIQG